MADFEWYRSFFYVYRQGTVSAAARALGLTQPAVSQHLAALESALGQALFTRTPRRMLPTARGRSLYSNVADSVERLESVTSDPKVRLDRIRLGAPAEFFALRVVEELPGLVPFSMSVTLGPSAELLEKLRAQELDVVISTIKRPDAELAYAGVFEETFWLVVPPDCVVPPRPRLEPWLTRQPWIAYDEDFSIIRRFWRQVFGRRFTVDVRLIVPDLRAILSAVKTGLGVSVLPDYLCSDAVAEGSVRAALEPKEPVTNDLWLVVSRHLQRSETVQALRDVLRGERASGARAMLGSRRQMRDVRR
jgi:DNA-binding transcriptional LysR family regulator